MTTVESTQPLQADLAMALRAAAHHGLSEGICNHFSVMLPGAHQVPEGFRGVFGAGIDAADAAYWHKLFG